MNLPSLESSPEVESAEGVESESPCLAEWLDNRRLLMVIAGALLGILALAALGMLYFAQAVVFPIALAFILSLVFGPVVGHLNRWGFPNFMGAALVVGGIIALSALAILFLSGPATQWFADAPDHFRELEFKLRSLKEPMEKVTNAGDQVAKLTEVKHKDGPISVEVKQPGVTAVLFNTTSEVVVGGFLTLVMLYFMLAGGDRLLEKVLSLTSERDSQREIVSLARDIQQSMSSYLLTTTCINIVLGTVIGAGMWLLGMPNPALWGVMAACLNFIPYFGCIVGACFVFVAGVISFDSLSQAIWAPILYFTANGIEGYFVTPSVLGRSISLSPLAIIIGMILWGWLWGVGGMLLAVPLLAATKIACDHIPPLHDVGRFLAR